MGDEAGRRGRTLWALVAGAASVGALAALPSTGPLAWLAFVLATAGIVAVLSLVPDGAVWGVVALFGLVAVKDAVPVVAGASVTAFHVVVAAVVVWALVRFARARPRSMPRLSLLEWALAGPFLAGLWSLPTSLAPRATALYSARLLLLWVVAVLVARSLGTDEARRKALVGLVAGGTLVAVIALVQWAWPGLGIGNAVVHGDSLDGTLIIRPAGFFLDPNFLGTHLVLASLAALALALGGGRRSLPWLVPAAPMLGVVAITYSRSSWVSLVVGLLVLAALVPRKARVRLAVACLVALVLGTALVGPASLLARVGSAFDLKPESSSATRLLMAESTLEMIGDRPVFGTGLEGFSEAYSYYRKPGAVTAVAHPHQIPLALVAETGVAGLVAQIALLWAMLVAVRRILRSGLTAVDAAVIAGLAGLLVGSLLQFFLYFEPLWLMAGLLAAAAEGAAGTSRRAEPA